jgi:hypothetical protein
MNDSPNATSANREGTALLVIDVQTALFERPTPIYKADNLLHNITALIQRAREAGVPVFYVQHANNSLLSEGSAGWQLHPQLQTMPPDDLIHKRHGSAFEETPLKGTLDARNVGTLVIAGLVTTPVCQNNESGRPEARLHCHSRSRCPQQLQQTSCQTYRRMESNAARSRRDSVADGSNQFLIDRLLTVCVITRCAIIFQESRTTHLAQIAIYCV